MTAADVSDATKDLDVRVEAAIEKTRALRAAGVDDPLGPYRADLEGRLRGDRFRTSADAMLHAGASNRR